MFNLSLPAIVVSGAMFAAFCVLLGYVLIRVVGWTKSNEEVFREKAIEKTAPPPSYVIYPYSEKILLEGPLYEKHFETGYGKRVHLNKILIFGRLESLAVLHIAVSGKVSYDFPLCSFELGDRVTNVAISELIIPDIIINSNTNWKVYTSDSSRSYYLFLLGDIKMVV